MTRASLQHSRPRPIHLARYVGGLFIALSWPASAQDIRGIEVCTAEKQMERRTGCLQANVEFLQQALAKLTRETQDKIASAGRDLAAARTEITELKSALTRLTGELAQMKAKAESSNSKKIETGGNK